MNKMQAMPAVCEKKLSSGDLCRVQATGRCVTCNEAFCMTHQALGYDGFHQLVPYADLCAPCLAKREAAAAERRQEAQAHYRYFESGAAQADLLKSGVSPVDIYDIATSVWEPISGPKLWMREIRSLFFDNKMYRMVTEKERAGRYMPGPDRIFGRGWLLGEFPWKYSVNNGYRESEEVRKTWLTALMDLPRNGDHRLDYYANNTLVRVQPYAESYQVIFEGRFDGDQLTGNGWKEAMQAVKRLTGGRSS